MDGNVFDVRDYGLTVDGDPLANAVALRRAIAACEAAGGGTISLVGVVGALIDLGGS